jgi:hypothetical protein
MMKIKEWLSKYIKQASAVTAIAFIVCFFAVPVVMASQEWNDHDRSKKVLARDLAKDYLESCAPNAILFSFGDNDTYPLWYAQEVEGIRPDVRVINTSLLGIDWYLNQLRYKVNKSAPIDVVWTPEQIEGRKRDIAIYRSQPQFPENRYYDLYDMMKNYLGNDANMDERGYAFFPVKKVSVPVNENTVIANQTVNATDSVVSEVRFEIPKNILYKNDLAILNIIAANQWKRPVYFTMFYDDLGFAPYLRRDGLTYRFVPVENSPINDEVMFNNIMKKFGYGNAQIPGVYFDEENRRHLNTIRRAHAELAIDLAQKNKQQEARQVLEKADKMMLQENFPYGMVSRSNEHNRISMMFLEACYRSEDSVLAKKVASSVKTDLQQQIKYYNGLTGKKAENMQYEKSAAENLLKMLNEMQQFFTKSASADTLLPTLQSKPIE